MLSDDEHDLFLDDAAELTPKNRFNLSGRWVYYKKPFNGLSTWLLLSHFTVFVATSLLWGSLAVINSSDSTVNHRMADSHTLDLSSNFTSNAELLTCGHSISEAKSLGCRYDILSNHWVPSPCMDQKAVEEYQSDGSWFGFADEKRTEMLDIDAMPEMDYYYTSERDHIVHCAMLWRKQFRAFYEERSHLDTIIGSFDHTMHCSQFLIDMSDRGPDYRKMAIKTFVGQAGCWVRN